MNSLVTRGSLFDDFFKDIAPGFYVRPLHGDNLPSPSQIKVDVKETEGGYTVQAEVPGVAKEDIHVSLEGNVVSLRAEVRQHDAKREGEKVLRSLYGLTPAEARLAQALVNGLSLQEYADQQSVSIHTVRSQFRTIATKAGVGRQTDFVRAVLTGPAMLQRAVGTRTTP